MAELVVGKHVGKKYGDRYSAVVHAEDREVHGTLRIPKDAQAIYLLATGLGGGKDSMRLPAHEAAKRHIASFAIDYSNKSFANTLTSDAKDIATSLEALQSWNKAMLLRLMALSKAGRTATMALATTEAKVQSASLVVPAGYIKNFHMSWVDGALAISTTVPELAGHAIIHPIDTIHKLAGCARNARQRSWAIIGEMNELRHGDVHDVLHLIKAETESPYIRFVGASHDGLLRSALQEASIARLPFDSIMTYRGGHTDLIKVPSISGSIYDLDAQLDIQGAFSSVLTPKPLAA